MPEEDATAARICAYWNALVRHHDLSEVPLEDDLAATIRRVHSLNIVVPASAQRRVRDMIEAGQGRPPEGASPMSPIILGAYVPAVQPRPIPNTRAWAAIASHRLVRDRVTAFLSMATLILVLTAASLAFIISRPHGPGEPQAMLPAVVMPQPGSGPVGHAITGGDDLLEAPAGVAVGPDGAIYVIDVPRDQVRVFNADGTPQATWGTSGDGPGEFGFSFDFAWGDLAVAPDGNVYVLDPNLARIQVFTADGEFLFTFSERGSEEGQILYPMGLGVGPNGNVYVADWQNHRVQVFASDGTFLASWERASDGPPLAGPTDVAVDPDGTAWVSDEILQRIFGFAPDGSVVATLGAIGDGPGEVRGPRSVAVDAEGNIYVTDYGNDRVQKLSRDGDVLGIVGAPGEDPGQLTDPTFLAVGSDGQVYVAEEGSPAIQVFPPEALIPPNILTTQRSAPAPIS